MEVYQRPSDGAWVPVPMPIPLRQVIRAALLNALAYTGGDQKRAAELLDLSVRNMAFHMDGYGIPSNRMGISRTGPAHRKSSRTHVVGVHPRPKES